MDESTQLQAAATPDMDQPVLPVGAERLVTLDFIRGIAVLGILFANITAFGHSFMVYSWPPAMPGGPNEADKLVWLLQYVLIDHKMRGLFTLLFGAGMMLFVEKAWARGAGRWLQFRRLLWLLVFGMIHFYFIWFGDILQLYAVWGIVALTMMRWKAKTQLLVGLALYGLGTLAIGGGLGANYYFATHPAAAATMSKENRERMANAESKALEGVREDVELYTTGGYAAFVRHQVVDQSVENFSGLVFGVIETLSLILIGMALYRFGFFSGALDPGQMRLWGWIGLLSGGLVSLALGLVAYCADFPFFLTLLVFEGLFMIPRLAFVLGLASLLVLWAPRAAQGWLGVRLVATGRMAFSNYLGISIVMLFVFHGWALGLYGQLHRLALFGIVLAAWAVMLGWSKPWLERYRYGPLEWLWRCLTYWQLFPFRR
ncbi:MAG: DUF418 domain-containing protein [Sphingomonadales bacterium]|nr:DUF418 domain-containing protein [Sphingomonadales bacterium]MBD3773947.1 DUF418 domain-containing protein [Paracoccaceae bacterium]MBD3814064.1 DUF418 domain-containing protein [Betaproteobacteria bacterium]